MALDNFIKIVGYREHTIDGKKKSSQKYWELPFNFQDHQTLYNNVETFLESNIPEADRYNLHYTINHVPSSSAHKNTVSKIEIIPFDIDNIIPEKIESYIKAVEVVIGLTRDNFVVISTGNGLQCIFLLETPFEDEGGYLSIKKSYILLCEEIHRELDRNSLITKRTITIGGTAKEKTTNCDTQILRVGTLRLPGTANIKEGYDNTKCVFITRQMKPVSLEKLRLYPENVSKYTTPKITAASFWGKTDSKFVFRECGALKEFKDKKGIVNYDQWFSGVSVISRFNDIDGEALAHELSKGDSRYSEEETQKLIDSTKTSGGPHTCETFSRGYEVCKGCKYFKTKIRSPINLRSAGFLSYEPTGFHKQEQNGVWYPYYKQIVQKFVQEFNYKLLYNTGEIYFFEQEKNCWVPMPSLQAKAILTTFFYSKPGDLAPSGVTRETFEQLKLTNGIQDDVFFEASQGKINFLNGHIEIKGNDITFFPITVDSFRENFTFALPFNYDESAECPKFIDFLDAVSLSRKDIEVSLCEYMGYTMSNDDYWAHKFLMLEGTGSNGKSVILDLLRYLVGEGNYASLGIRDMTDDQKKAGLVGKIANISDEQPKKNFLESADLKNLTSGGEFNYKRLYQQPGLAKCRAKFVFSTNHAFQTNDSSSGTRRRYHPIPFEANFNPDEGPTRRTPDVKILEKLQKEAAGIFNYCIRLYLEAKKRGAFTVSDASKAMIKEFVKNTSPISNYIEEVFELDKYKTIDKDLAEGIFKATRMFKQGFNNEDYARISINLLRKDYLAWSDDNGYQGKYNAVNFGKEFRMALMKHIPDKEVLDTFYKRVKIDNKFFTIFIGRWSPFLDNDSL